MNEARKFAKSRKPVQRIWSLPRRPVVVRRKDVTPKEFEALQANRKFPPRLFKALEEPFRCGTPFVRAAEFVGPPRPCLVSRNKGYPLTNWKRKRLECSHSYKYFKRRVLRDPRYT